MFFIESYVVIQQCVKYKIWGRFAKREQAVIRLSNKTLAFKNQFGYLNITSLIIDTKKQVREHILIRGKKYD